MLLTVVDADLAARGAEAGLAGEGYAALVLAVGADVECIAGIAHLQAPAAQVVVSQFLRERLLHYLIR